MQKFLENSLAWPLCLPIEYVRLKNSIVKDEILIE